MLPLIGGPIGAYNGLIEKRSSVRNKLKGIDIQLERRFRVIEQLVDAVKQYMTHESGILKDITKLRHQSNSALEKGDRVKQLTYENEIGYMVKSVNVRIENYPELKASTTVLQLQKEIVDSENRLAEAGRDYNNACELFNSSCNQFPTTIFASLFGKRFMPFEYWSGGEQKTNVEL